tara:strand:+ start:26482 stop:27324 length:843 start_codon:yes stop_codon:yes gene_type:complete
MKMQTLELKNPELIEKLDALAIKVDEIFENKTLLDRKLKEEWDFKCPAIRKEQSKDDPYVASPHWDILPWSMNDTLKEGQMSPVGREYLEYQMKLMRELGPLHHETKGFPNLEPFLTGKKLWTDHEEDFAWLRDMVYDISAKWLGGSAMALCAFYIPGAHIPWHHNGNAPGHNILLHYNKVGKGSFYTYDEGEIIEYKDKPGWVARAGIFYDTISDPNKWEDKLKGKYGRSEQTYTTPILADSETACWHSAYAESNRFTLSTVIPDRMIWEDLCEEIEEA